MTRGKIEMARTGSACSANAASATPPLRGTRHGSVISITIDDAGPEDDRLREEQPERKREARRDERVQRKMQRIDRRRRDRVAEQHFVADEQQRDGRARAKLRDRKDRPLAGGFPAAAGDGGRVRRSRSTRSNASTTTAAMAAIVSRKSIGVRSSVRSPGPSAAVRNT